MGSVFSKALGFLLVLGVGRFCSVFSGGWCLGWCSWCLFEAYSGYSFSYGFLVLSGFMRLGLCRRGS